MGTYASPRVVGRLAGLLFVASGALTAVTVLLPLPPGTDPLAVLTVCFGAVACGGAAFLLPWNRWPRRATLVLLPLAFVLIAAGNYFSGDQPYTYSAFFIVAFVWVGLAHDRWTSVWFIPPAAVAYAIPIVMLPGPRGVALSSIPVVMVVCAFVAEIIAWMSARDHRSRAQANALARVAAALGPHLDAEAVAAALAEEMRIALGAEGASFTLIRDGKLHRIYTAVDDSELRAQLESLEGQDIPPDSGLDRLREGPLVVNDVRTAEGPILHPDRFGIKSYMAVPVMVEDELAAILSCGERRRPRRYTNLDITIATAMVNQASAALQNALLYEKALDASRRDPLTSLENRRAFHIRLDNEIARARRHVRPLSLIVLDVDRLKRVNDEHGHLAGDRVLDRVGGLLRENSRVEDGVFRIGGDEFALVLPETFLDGANVVAERIRRSVARGRAGSDGDGPVTVSVGVSAFPSHGVNPDELFERADTALLEVKRSGRNAVATATEHGTGTPGVRFGVDVRSVITDGRLAAYYQPIFRLANRTVLGYEGLCRLDPAYGSAPTATLFRAAASLGLTQSLDRLCRQAALEGARDLWPGHLLFVNTSPAALEVDDFDVGDMLQTVARVGLEPSNIVIEVTEQERTRSPRLMRNLEACREAGMGTSLDDFAAALTDMELVAATHFDYVKVDTSLVHGEGGDVRKKLFRGLMDMVQDTGAHAVAEGVETLQDLEYVWDLGFYAAQGFFLSDPERQLNEDSHIDLTQLRSVRD